MVIAISVLEFVEYAVVAQVSWVGSMESTVSIHAFCTEVVESGVVGSDELVGSMVVSSDEVVGLWELVLLVLFTREVSRTNRFLTKPDSTLTLSFQQL